MNPISVESYFFLDPVREADAQVTSTHIQKLGMERLVIDEQAERGAGDYLHYTLNYTGYEESNLNYALEDDVLTIWRTIWGDRQKNIRFGKPLEIKISKENGFVPVDNSILKEYTSTLPSCGPRCPN